MAYKRHPDPEMRPERVNSRIHSIGILMGLIGFPLLLFYASQNKTQQSLLSAIIYGFCFIMTFTLSSLFHKSPSSRRRSFLKVSDRISIYFLIAGSYTPLVTHYLQSATGTYLLISVWLLAAFGIVFELYLVKKYILISVPLFILMGCLFIFTSTKFFAAMPQMVMILVITGIILYLAGIIFYLWEKWEYNHAIWHVFVLLAATCHYIAILLTVRGN